MNEKGIQKIADLAVEAASKTVEIKGQVYAHESLKPKHLRFPTCEPIKLSTLTGLVDLLKADRDGWLGARDVKITSDPGPSIAPIIHIVSPTRVELRGIQRDDDYRTRDVFAVAEYAVQPYQFGQYLERETFQIHLMSRFDKSQHRDDILKLIGNVDDAQKVTTKDDGVSQSVVAKTGVVHVDNFVVPNPVTLAPWRSFAEIDAQASLFVFRVGGGAGRPVTCALFEADGGAWALDVVDEIEKFLADSLKEEIAAGKLVIVK